MKMGKKLNYFKSLWILLVANIGFPPSGLCQLEPGHLDHEIHESSGSYKALLISLKALPEDAQNTLTPTTLACIKGATQTLDSENAPPLPLPTIYPLCQIAESYTNETVQQQSTWKPFDYLDQNLLQRQITFEKDSDGHLYMSFQLSKPARGGSKEVSAVLRFPDWLPAVSIQLQEEKKRRSPDIVKNFEFEKSLLSKVQSLPAEKRVGIVESLSIGDKIFEVKYDADLFSLIYERQVPLSPEFRRMAAIQLSAGLVTIHHLGFCLGDIKPENILVKFDRVTQQPIDIVHTDFDLAYEPLEQMNKNSSRPLVGTMPYLAPEELIRIENFSKTKQIDAGWYGKTSSNSTVEMCKGDVFTLATVIFRLVHHDPKLGARTAPWITRCMNQNSSIADFLSCRNTQLDYYFTWVSRHSKRPDFIPMDAVLVKALHPDPLQRIDSEEFHREIVEWMEKPSVAE